MGDLAPFPPVKLFVGILLSPQVPLADIITMLSAEFGDIDFQSPCFSFGHTAYYAPEMGEGLLKYVVSFNTPWMPNDMYRVKLKTQVMEDAWKTDGKRKLNLDPGYISDYQVVLLTTKNYAHRIPLQGGIYAELTYTWVKGNFTILPWTYPDFQRPEYKDVFTSIRRLYGKEKAYV
jgi:hypothetical protein